MTLKTRSSSAPPAFVLTRRGMLAMAWSLSPLLLLIPALKLDIGIKTIVATTIINLALLGFLYMQRRRLWIRQEQQRVRGASGVPLVNVAFASAAVSGGVLFFLMMGGLALFEKLPPLLLRFASPLLYAWAWGGIGLLFDLLAVLGYSERLVQADVQSRPLYLDPDVDLLDIARPTLEKDLGLGGKDTRIIEREREKNGGVRFVITWQENVQRDRPDAATGKTKTIEFTEEQAYEVKLDVRGNIVSLKARK